MFEMINKYKLFKKVDEVRIKENENWKMREQNNNKYGDQKKDKNL